MTTIMKPTMITVHCSATENLKSANIEAMRQDHIVNRGFTDIAYHILIQPDGTPVDGRPLNQVGAHVEGHNAGNVGICLIGTDKFTKAQFDKLLDKVMDIQQIFDVPNDQIYTHNQWDTAIKQGKTCPNISINSLLSFLLTHRYEYVKDKMKEIA